LGDTIRRAVLQTDSFQVQLTLARWTRGINDMRVALYRLPINIDTSSTFDSLNRYFSDSTHLADAPLPTDSGNDTVKVTFPSGLVTTFAADSSALAVGIAVRSASPSFVSVKTVVGGRGAQLTRFIQVDSVPGVRVKRIMVSPTFLDTYVFLQPPPPPAGVLAVGGAPSRRTFMRLSVPSRIVDSSTIVRATLLLFPAVPVNAAPGDTLRVLARPVTADIGPKSPVLLATADTARGGQGRAPPGSHDTVKVDLPVSFDRGRETPPRRTLSCSPRRLRRGASASCVSGRRPLPPFGRSSISPMSRRSTTRAGK
jgi:hypothetical protein